MVNPKLFHHHHLKGIFYIWGLFICLVCLPQIPGCMIQQVGPQSQLPTMLSSLWGPTSMHQHSHGLRRGERRTSGACRCACSPPHAAGHQVEIYVDWDFQHLRFLLRWNVNHLRLCGIQDVNNLRWELHPMHECHGCTCIFHSHFVSGGPLQWSWHPMAVVAAPAAPVLPVGIDRPFILGGWRSTRWALSERTDQLTGLVSKMRSYVSSWANRKPTHLEIGKNHFRWIRLMQFNLIYMYREIGSRHIWRLIKIIFGEFAPCNPIWFKCKE
jgi:hypothetical protein